MITIGGNLNMNENNLTGYDRDVAQQNIKDFSFKVYQATGRLDETIQNLFSQLSIVWASDNAVAFYNEYNAKYEELISSIRNQEDLICQNAVRAYNIVASAHHSEGFRLNEHLHLINVQYSKPGTVAVGNKIKTPLLKDINGVIGMNTSLVRDYLLPEFTIATNKVIDNFNSLPTEIALYDAEGTQGGAYKVSVESMIKNVTTFLNDLLTEIKKALETEADNIELAKQQATDALNA